MNKIDFLSRAASQHRLFAGRYDYSMIPVEFKAIEKIPIVCKEHGIFYQKAMSHLLGYNCIKCATSTDKKMCTSVFIARSKNLFGDAFDYSQTTYNGKEKQLDLICRYHGKFTIFPYRHCKLQTGCPGCEKELYRVKAYETFKERAQAVHAGFYIYPSIDSFENTVTPISIICPLHGVFKQSTYDHSVRECRCPDCAILANRLTLDSFKQKALEIHGRFYNYDFVKFEKASEKVTIVCPNHGAFQQRVRSHLDGVGCRKCHIDSSKKGREAFIAEAVIKHMDKYDYSRINYLGNKRKVEIICRKHGSFWIKPNAHLSSRQGCPRCIESKGEAMIAFVLDSLGIRYLREFKFLPFQYRYDFYIPEKNILIEYNGIQHYKPVDVFGGIESFVSTQQRDIAKVNLAKVKGCKLEIISYRVNTLEGIRNALANLF